MQRHLTSTADSHLNRSHHLAQVAAGHCRDHDAVLIGAVACGACWELAIRDDERIVVECGLPREIEPDPSYVDEIAVRRACQGERISLTAADRAEAIRRLTAAGYTRAQIASRLRLAFRDVPAVATQLRRLATAA